MGHSLMHRWPRVPSGPSAINIWATHRCIDGPECHLGHLLVQTETKVSDDELVWVVPVARASKGLEAVLLSSVVLNDVQDTLPGVLRGREGRGGGRERVEGKL